MESVDIVEFDSLWHGFHAATMCGGKYNSIKDAAIGVVDGEIAWIGEHSELSSHNSAQIFDLGGGWLTPGLIDCHTHLVFGGNRAAEFEQRLNGVSYTEIAKVGGGIAASVKATRKETKSELLYSAKKRLKALIADGVTTVEIKSGYGLNLEN